MRKAAILGAIYVWCLLLPAQAQDVTSLPEFLQAQSTARELLEGSRNLLMKELQDKGAAGALRACSAVALDLAKKREKEGWRIRRVSLQVRNPADSPDSYEKAVLEKWAGLHAQGKLPQEGLAEVAGERGRERLRYMRPIVISAQLCLQCHGRPEDIAPDVRSLLAQLYPGDRATGYKFMDLRGAVSISIPLASAK